MIKLLYFSLFLINVLLILFREAPINTVGGDEVVAYTTLLPFIHGLTSGIFFPSFLTFFHEPMFQIIQIPVIFFGASIFFVRVPNMLASILIFVVLYKIGKELFGRNNLYTVALLCLYIANGFFQVYRSELNHSLFNLFMCIGTLYLLRFDKKGLVNNFHKAFIFFLLSVFTYIDGIFSLIGLGLYWLFTKKRNTSFFDPRLIIYACVALVVFAIWAGAVYFGSVFSGVYSWQNQAPFSLLARGMSYSIFGIAENINLFTKSNTTLYLLFIFIFSIISVFSKKSRPVWLLLIIPIIYFNLVKMPTVHLLNFFTLFLITSALGLEVFLIKFPKIKILVLAIFVISLMSNLYPLKFFNPFIADEDFKVAATKLRSISKECDKVLTDLDGYTFRFYFNRGYTNEFSSDINYAVLEEKRDLPGFNMVAQSSKFSIYTRGSKEIFEEVEYIDSSLFNFENSMTYQINCQP